MMDEIIWSDDLITGNEIVDFQHKKLFSYLDLLKLAAKSEDSRSSLLENTIYTLIEYTILHFEDEEIVLENNGYPDLLAHQKLHNDFSKQILDFKQRFDTGENVMAELALFVKNWFLEHIKEEDMKALKCSAKN